MRQTWLMNTSLLTAQLFLQRLKDLRDLCVAGALGRRGPLLLQALLHDGLRLGQLRLNLLSTKLFNRFFLFSEELFINRFL